MVGGQARVGERDGGQAGVPHRGLTGLDHPGAVLAPHGEPVERLQPGPHHGVLEVVAEQVQGDHGVHGGWLDAAPAAVVLLALDDPAGGAAHRGPAQLAGRHLAVAVQHLVEPLEDAVPTRHRGKGFGRIGGAGVGVQLIEREGRGPYRALRGDHGERHDGLPGPAAEVVDVERDPLGQEDQLGRQLGQVVPLPPAEQGQPDPGEHPCRSDSAVRPDPPGGAGHVRVLGPVSGESEGDVRLDGGGQFAGAAEEGGPGSVVPLLAPDEQGGRLDGLLVLHPEELAKQQILGVHGDVGLQVALPPALGVLPAEQVLDAAFRGPRAASSTVSAPGGALAAAARGRGAPVLPSVVAVMASPSCSSYFCCAGVSVGRSPVSRALPATASHMRMVIISFVRRRSPPAR